jgi:hypothetical protein
MGKLLAHGRKRSTPADRKQTGTNYVALPKMYQFGIKDGKKQEQARISEIIKINLHPDDAAKLLTLIEGMN